MLIILIICRSMESLAQLGGGSSHRSLHPGKVFVDRGLSALSCRAQMCCGPTLTFGQLISVLFAQAGSGSTPRARHEGLGPKVQNRRLS